MYVLFPSVIVFVLLSSIPSSKGWKFFWWNNPAVKRSAADVNRNASSYEVPPVKVGIRFDNVTKYTELDSMELKKKMDKNFTTTKSQVKYFHEYLKSPFRPFAFFGQSKQRTFHQNDLKPYNVADLPTLLPILSNISRDAELFLRFKFQGI
ncbi:hypothetical protein O3M35_010843 [Rhynocoris fuscipes]|uniref:Uncharacterized protein n=1 Tax=Rhynocoris fuscipes TaxID=488301 RepID=A0AAW1D1Y4_9HEMI